MHLAISPVLLGSGEPLLAGIDLAALGYRCTEHVGTEQALHVVLTKGADRGPAFVGWAAREPHPTDALRRPLPLERVLQQPRIAARAPAAADWDTVLHRDVAGLVEVAAASCRCRSAPPARRCPRARSNTACGASSPAKRRGDPLHRLAAPRRAL